MNKEEKKAIKIVNSLKEWGKIHFIVKDRSYARLTYNEVYLLLNLIEKLQKENEKLKNQEATQKKINELLVERYSTSISVKKVKDLIDRIDYDIKKTKEIISNNSNIYTSDRKNDYQIVRLRAMNTKSLDIKKRLQELLEGRKENEI